MLRGQPPHQAGVAEQVRADLALLIAQEYAVNPPRQQPGQVGLAHRQRQLAETAVAADVEGIELYFVIVLAL